MFNRIFTAIILPVVAVGVIISIWATSSLVPPLLGFIQKRTEASLQLVTHLGLEKCENSFNYLIDLRLEDNQGMVESLQRETLQEIRALSELFDKIQLVVLDADGGIIGEAATRGQPPVSMIDQTDTSGRIVQQVIFSRPARVSAYYFPMWRWYIVGYIYETDYAAPLSMARNIIFGSTFGVLLVIIATAGLAFYFRVNQPLRRILHATEKVAVGEFKTIDVVDKDEIGKVATGFNSMVESLKNDQQRIKEILSALRESEELYRVVTENSLSQILLVHRYEIIFANQRALEDSGYSARELLGDRALNYIHHDDRRDVRRMVRKRYTGKLHLGAMECRYITKSGDMRWLELTVVPTTYQGQPVLLGHGIDITQRKSAFEEQQRLESKLRQAQKMESIGTLAGGIAHDFNNLLMGVQGNISLMLLGVTKEDPNRERLFNIQRYIKNGAELTRQLLGYARRGKYEVKPIPLNDLVTESANMFARTKKEISIHLDLQSDLWTVEADRGQIEQVLLNLYVNAWQAMPSGGDLFLVTENVSLNRHGTAELSIQPGDYVCISVTDTGIGMDEQIVQKIFDPFFTTKQRERGTGLGLASAYGIIRNHGGGIACSSRPNIGTTFNFCLPRSEKSVVDDDAVVQQMEPGSETILLVDDEQMVLSVGQEMLRYLGYQVIKANSGQAAVDIVNDPEKELDLVILDMIMPEMGGGETFDIIHERRPELPVLLCSGYSLDDKAAKILDRGCDGFIQKPFDLDKLSRRIREIFKHRL
ncbi:MAG: response regulator [Desulfobacteraceae bacterium]|jgi:PAS domain S-box-containing protein